MDRARLKELERSVDIEEQRARNGYYDYIHKGYIEAEYTVIVPTPYYKKPFFVSTMIGIGAFVLCVLLTILFLSVL